MTHEPQCKGNIITDILYIDPDDIKGYDERGMIIMKRKYGKFKRSIHGQILNKEKSCLNQSNKS